MQNGLTMEAYNYSGEVWPTALSLSSPAVARSLNVWSPGNGQIESMSWAALEPSQGIFNWAPLDAWIAANQAHGTPMLYSFDLLSSNIPSWAQTNADFQVFVTAIVQHVYGAIQYWEGANEIDGSTGVSPLTAAQAQQIIYNTVHSLDHGGLVLSATVSNTIGAAGIYGQFLADGGAGYFDIAAMHGYAVAGNVGSGLLTNVTDFKATLTQYGLQNLPIWDTEWGLYGQHFSSSQQEAYVATGLIAQDLAGVSMEAFYAYDDRGTSLDVIQSNGVSANKLSPAGTAYKTVTGWLSNGTLSSYTNNNGVYAAPITENGQNDLLVWDTNGSASYSTTYHHYVDITGATHSISHGHVNISSIPILLMG